MPLLNVAKIRRIANPTQRCSVQLLRSTTRRVSETNISRVIRSYCQILMDFADNQMEIYQVKNKTIIKTRKTDSKKGNKKKIMSHRTSQRLQKTTGYDCKCCCGSLERMIVYMYLLVMAVCTPASAFAPTSTHHHHLTLTTSTSGIGI